MSESVHDDCTDLAAAQRGQQAAFGRMFDRHAAVLLSLCRRGVAAGSFADAEDAMQETFIRAFRKLDDVHDCRGLRAWIYRIARLVCSERRRSEARRHRHEEHAMEQTRLTMDSTTAHSARAEGPVASASDNATHGRPRAELERREQLSKLSAALDRLEDDERLAIHFYYLDSDPVRAAQAALGIGRSGFYKLLARARESLAAQLREVVQS